MKPLFTPKQIGETYIDPTTKKTWEYTKDGWIEKSTDIKKENQDTKSFDVNIGDEGLAQQLKAGGASDTQIQASLSERKRIIANLKQTGSETDKNDSVIPAQETSTIDSKNPFSGLTRTEVLRDAFNKGLTNKDELKKLGELYDMIAEPDTTENMDISQMNPAERLLYKTQLQKTAISKMQELPDATARDSALGALSTFESGQEIINMLKDKKVETGLGKSFIRNGIFGVGARSLGMTTKEEDYFNALSETFAAQFRKAISGTAVSDVEAKRLDRFLPNESKTAQANIEGVMALADYLSNKTSIQLGIDVSPLKPEEPSNDPLDIFKKNINSKDNPMGI